MTITGKVMASGFQKETEKFGRVLNGAGEAGWELVSVQDPGVSGGLSATNSRSMMVVFKRPTPDT